MARWKKREVPPVVDWIRLTDDAYQRGVSEEVVSGTGDGRRKPTLTSMVILIEVPDALM
jgi:hypothetical protein